MKNVFLLGVFLFFGMLATALATSNEAAPSANEPTAVANYGGHAAANCAGAERSVLMRQGAFGRVHKDRFRAGGVFPLFRGGCAGERRANRENCGG